MKFGNFWITTVGAGVVIAGMMTAGRAAMQSPAILFLAGQIKVATGNTEDGMRLMNEAAAQRDVETGKVHAAEPEAKPIEVCTNQKAPTAGGSRPAARPVKTVSLKAKAPVAVMAKLEYPKSPFTVAVSVPPEASVVPTSYQYLNETQRAQVIRIQNEFQKLEHERVKEAHRAARAVVIKYMPAGVGFNPSDMSNIDRDLPMALGQIAQ